MNNKDYIEAYKSEENIITDYYKYYLNGKKIDITGIVNPLKIDNRQLMSPTDNQTNTPHCAGYSAATLIESIYWKQTGKLLQLDSHQVYALAKQLDGAIYSEGTYLEAALKAVLQLCKNDDNFNFLDNAKIETFYNDKTQNTIENVKYLLHKYDFLQAGFMCYDGWMNCNNLSYIINCTGRNLGGHAVVLSYYDKDYVGITNQWGIEWGAKGNALMSWKDFLNSFMYGAYIDY